MASLFGFGLVGNYDHLLLWCCFEHLHIHGCVEARIAAVFAHATLFDISTL